MITKDDQDKGYKSGDYKLIFKNTHDDEVNGKPKKYTISANSPNSPDVFYFVQIDVDLDRIKVCTCQEIDWICPSDDETKEKKPRVWAKTVFHFNILETKLCVYWTLYK